MRPQKRLQKRSQAPATIIALIQWLPDHPPYAGWQLSHQKYGKGGGDGMQAWLLYITTTTAITYLKMGQKDYNMTLIVLRGLVTHTFYKRVAHETRR